MGETRVDLLHLLEDLRDAYPGATEETILTEIIANSLDSGATSIEIATDTAKPAALTIVDNGAGMRRRELARYHDVAATTKVRGAGIGFAGVGIKIALLVCEEVLTETRRDRHHVATAWRLGSRHRAPWKWVPPPGFVQSRGTAVQLRPINALSPLLDTGFIEEALRRHFQPLLDPFFDDILTSHYPQGARFVLNGRPIDRQGWRGGEEASIAVRLGRRRKPVASGYMIRSPAPLPEERQGIAVATFGKTIKRGWDWLGIAPQAPAHVGGLIETPALAECLTLNKADFIRTGARGATYLAYRKAIQEAVSQQLVLWGDTRDTGERARRRAARPVERDLEVVLMDLADQFPLLATLVERRAGGQRRLPMGGLNGKSQPVDSETPLLTPPAPMPSGAGGGALAPAVGSDEATDRPEESALPEELGAREQTAPPRVEGHLMNATATRGRARYGLSIQFEQRPEDPELGRLVESTVWVNEAHPAYRRALTSRSEGYHVALATAMALAPLAVEPAKEHEFLTAFLATWGAAIERHKDRKRR
jgi:hypothetical protein